MSSESTQQRARDRVSMAPRGSQPLLS